MDEAVAIRDAVQPDQILEGIDKRRSDIGGIIVQIRHRHFELLDGVLQRSADTLGAAADGAVQIKQHIGVTVKLGVRFLLEGLCLDADARVRAACYLALLVGGAHLKFKGPAVLRNQACRRRYLGADGCGAGVVDRDAGADGRQLLVAEKLVGKRGGCIFHQRHHGGRRQHIQTAAAHSAGKLRLFDLLENSFFSRHTIT